MNQVADFGAARAQTSEATQLLQSSINILSVDKLRNGDWKEDNDGNGGLLGGTGGASGSTGGGDGVSSVTGGGIARSDGDGTDQEQGLAEDERLEGTPAYLPPEV